MNKNKTIESLSDSILNYTNYAEFKIIHQLDGTLIDEFAEDLVISNFLLRAFSAIKVQQNPSILSSLATYQRYLTLANEIIIEFDLVTPYVLNQIKAKLCNLILRSDQNKPIEILNWFKFLADKYPKDIKQEYEKQKILNNYSA